MSDFTNPIVIWWIVIGTLGGILGCLLLVLGNNIKKPEGEVKPTGHVWDEDLEEFDNPLPRWWFFLFLGCVAFALGYLALYPGLGSYKGVFNWTSVGQYEDEVAQYDEKYAELYAGYAAQPIETLAKNKEAMVTGGRLFSTYCTVCHATDARGQHGFPNLTDEDWLWGGSPDAIKTTILKGRQANMPAKGGLDLTDDEIYNVTDYVLGLSGRKVDAISAQLGKVTFDKICVVCHTATGEGNQQLGSANLTDNTWLYGSSKTAVLKTIKNGRNGVMPAHEDFLGEEKVHLLAAYVYSLSANK